MITHKGIIHALKPQLVVVKIEATSACAACHAKQACGMEELKEKWIEVPVKDSSIYNIGDEVEVEMKTSTGFKAVFFAYLAPFLIMAIVFIILYNIQSNEGLTAIGALASIVLYYLGLSRHQKFLNKQIQFSLKS